MDHRLLKSMFCFESRNFNELLKAGVLAGGPIQNLVEIYLQMPVNIST